MNDFITLDWSALVTEARRRRTKEGLTQGEHANLAGVSRDTIRSFDRYEKTITLEKALQILKVVGLVADDRRGGLSTEEFIARCLIRWQTLTEDLETADPARLEHGFYFICYELLGATNQTLTAPEGWIKILSTIPSVSGWSPFRISKKRVFQPIVHDDELECWLGKPEAREDKVFIDAPHLDFWRVSPSGELFILRGYREDGDDSAKPGTFLDVSLPLWRSGDIVEHARLLVGEITKRKLGEITGVRFTARWSGLSGRLLVDWADPTRGLTSPGRYRCRLNEVRSTADAEPTALGVYPDEILKTLIQPLYQSFDFVDPDYVEQLFAERREKMERQNWG